MVSSAITPAIAYEDRTAGFAGLAKTINILPGADIIALQASGRCRGIEFSSDQSPMLFIEVLFN
jgi:hypothetical protein